MARVDFVRCAAPSFKALRIAGKSLPTGRDSRGRGAVPRSRVVVATDTQGRTWQHERIFESGELDTARKLMLAVEARGEINPAHWRLTERKEY